MKTLHSARVVVMRRRNASIESTSTSNPPSFSKDLDMGMQGDTDSEWLFGAAYATSIASLLQLIAEQEDICLSQNSSVTSSLSWQKDDFFKLHFKISLDCYLPDITEAQATKLISIAFDKCPYSNVLRDSVKITFNWLSD